MLANRIFVFITFYGYKGFIIDYLIYIRIIYRQNRHFLNNNSIKVICLLFSCCAKQYSENMFLNQIRYGRFLVIYGF